MRVPYEDEDRGLSRRQYLQRTLVAGAGVAALGVDDTAGAELRRPMTKAGPGHPEHGGRFGKPSSKPTDLKTIEALAKKGEWHQAATRLGPHLKGKGAVPHDVQQLKQKIGQQIEKALNAADAEAKKGKKDAALAVYRNVASLHKKFGFQKRAKDSIARHARIKRPPERPTTFAEGEEGGRGGRPQVTTLAIGEEG